MPSQGYDTALAIGAALKGAGGKVDDTEAFRAAMLKADFQSVRGNFKFGPNQHPVQDWYSLRVEKGARRQASPSSPRRKILDGPRRRLRQGLQAVRQAPRACSNSGRDGRG